MTLIDLYNDFSRTAQTEGYPASARILGYTLIYVWNERRRPAECSVTRSELQRMTGLPETSFRRAADFLAGKHWIKRLSGARTAFNWRFNGVNATASACPQSRAPEAETEAVRKSPRKGDFRNTTNRGESNDIRRVEANRTVATVRGGESCDNRRHQAQSSAVQRLLARHASAGASSVRRPD